MAFQIGVMAIKHVNTGLMITLFPTIVQDDEGKPRSTISHFPTLLLRPEDAARMMGLSKVITEVNQKTLKARQGGPADELTATVGGAKAKDNALADLKAKAQGKSGGIIIA